DPVKGLVTFTYKGNSVTYGTVISETGRCWLDRNLGASRVAISKTDSQAYGDLFQWGKLDDGHQDRNSNVRNGTSNSDNPGHGDFLRRLNDSGDWRNPRNDNLWQGVDGINNPCPLGFRIPTITEWENEKNTWTQQGSNGAYASNLKLSTGGERYFNGTIWKIN